MTNRIRSSSGWTLAAAVAVFAVVAGAGSVSAVATAETKPAQAKPPEPRVVKVAGNDSMQFLPRRIEVRPGERLRVVLSSSGSMDKAVMAHNWVLLAKGTDVAAFAMAAATARDSGYIPPAQKGSVVAMTPGMIGNGETAEVVFTAPLEPGEYVYVCTFPAHFIGGMRGVLVVK